MNNNYKTPSAKKMADYNTQKEHLIIREYGRNTQNLINHAKTIEDQEERQIYIEKIVRLIMSMHPHTRNVDDYRLKVWSHVLKMADYELEVDLPENLPDARKKRKPDQVSYPKNTKRLRHYGRNVRIMIEKAKKMEDKEQQDAYVAIIGAYMKMSYKAWNRENVNDEVIFEEFAKISRGELVIPEGTNIDSLIAPRKKKTGGNSGTARKTTRHSNSKNNSKNSNNKKKNNNSKGRNSNNNKNQRNRKR
ncbi:DUF4290 domain-containing protein [Aureispira anguillae]|uniref:DUF4290 domain-containing protein n=1 Tax=Aureispira anguillae TaxID=2864201 RepID=A0A915YLW4_9BACT|nr:DUF4290 domain-containing protein [Aureispira anguillae]BDS15168.1 DUF4290 domain-containing protein [Aureispira anguillae]